MKGLDVGRKGAKYFNKQQQIVSVRRRKKSIIKEQASIVYCLLSVVCFIKEQASIVYCLLSVVCCLLLLSTPLDKLGNVHVMLLLTNMYMPMYTS